VYAYALCHIMFNIKIHYSKIAVLIAIEKFSQLFFRRAYKLMCDISVFLVYPFY